jgi:Kdo2-lipid IVA lauroyltransferase/acyltransferase
MGIQTATLTTTARLAKTSKAAVIYVSFERLSGNSGYQLRLLPALKNFPSGDDVADAHRVNQLIETQVRRIPEQYLWLHRRFKTRPPGEPALYGWADKYQPPPKKTRHKNRNQQEQSKP